MAVEYRCFVGGLAWATTDQSLMQAFSQYGKVIESKIINDRETGRSRGFGFVTFKYEKSMKNAIEAMNGQDLDGRSITVNKAQSRGGGGGGGGGYGRREGGGGYGGGGGGYGRREYRCFVGGLAWATTDQSLKQAFSQYGEVIESKIINDHETGRSRGFGFVTFKYEESLKNAIEAMDGQDLDGRYITVNEAQSRGGGGGGYGRREYRCFVGGLAWATTDQSLKQAFSQCGEVIESKIINDRETGRSRGFGFVTFKYEESMKNAIEAMDGQDLDGRSITVNKAQFN